MCRPSVAYNGQLSQCVVVTGKSLTETLWASQGLAQALMSAWLAVGREL